MRVSYFIPQNNTVHSLANDTLDTTYSESDFDHARVTKPRSNASCTGELHVAIATCTSYVDSSSSQAPNQWEWLWQDAMLNLSTEQWSNY